MSIEKLKSLLIGIPAGAVPASLIDELIKLVKTNWHEFSGSGDTSMTPWKISRKRPEEVSWSPPCLSFVIDRHGGAALGSTRAERQRWTLNLERWTANHVQIGHRQLHANAKKLDVKLLADDICTAVCDGPRSASRFISDEVVVWKNDDELTVFHGKIVGGDYQRTVSGRRKRFRVDLKTKMEAVGWELCSIGRGLAFKRAPAHARGATEPTGAGDNRARPRESGPSRDPS